MSDQGNSELPPPTAGEEILVQTVSAARYWGRTAPVAGALVAAVLLFLIATGVGGAASAGYVAILVGALAAGALAKSLTDERLWVRLGADALSIATRSGHRQILYSDIASVDFGGAEPQAAPAAAPQAAPATAPQAAQAAAPQAAQKPVKKFFGITISGG